MHQQKKSKAAGMLWASTRGVRGRICAIVLMRVLQSVLYIIFILASRALIDSATAQDFPGLTRAAIGLGIVALIQLSLRYAVRWTDASTQNLATIQIRTRFFESILAKKQRDLSAYHSAILLDRLSKDVPDLVAYPVSVLPDFIGTIAGLFCALWTLFIINQLLPVVLVAAGLLVCGFGRVLQRITKRNYRVTRAAHEQMNAYYQESLANSLMLKVFGAQKQAVARARDFEQNTYGTWKHWFSFNQLLKTGISAFFNFGYVGALIFSSVLMARGLLSFGSLTAVLQLVDEIQDPFSSLGDLLSSKYVAQAAAERMSELEQLPEEKQGASIDAQSLYEGMAALEIRDVSFRYDRQNVLKNASAHLEKGDFVVLGGASGAGKSTLLNLLLGVYEDYSGRIELVMTNGERLALSSGTRPLFAYVPQVNMVFSGTVRENLTFLCGESTDDAIWRAARLADAEEFLRALPAGLDTLLGEQGHGLSQGQAQRLAIARALLTNAPILVLDEATSALDEKTERLVLSNIRTLKNVTLLIISHRRAAFDICNREWRLCNGQLEGSVLDRDR